MPDDLDQRLKTVLARVLGIDASAVSPTIKMGDHPNWDSLGHMNLVAAVEKEFKVRFPSYALPRITDLPSLRREVSALQAGGAR